MGQSIGKLVSNEQDRKAQTVTTSIKPLLNLPRSKIIDLRCAVSEISESGYSVTNEELEQVLRICLHEFLSDEKIRGYSNALFKIFSADPLSGSNRDEVDSFELLGTLCLMSGQVLEDKIDFIFALFDLNERGELCVNELTLAFRSLVTGVYNMTNDAAKAVNEDIDQVALEAFDLVVPDSLKYSIAMADDNKLTKHQFRDYVFNCPEVAPFLHCYDDIVLGGSEIQSPTTRHIEAEEEFTQVHEHCEHWRDQQRFLRPIIEEGKPLPPMDGLKLQRIYGRNSGTEVAYTSNGDILYTAGSIVIKLVEDENGYQQEFFNEHSNLVSSLDVFKVDGTEDMVVSADMNGTLHVWSSNTFSSLISFSTRHKNGVSKICFSPSGELLLTIGRNDMHVTIEVYEWRERRLLFATNLQGSKFDDCSFLSSDNSFGVCGEYGVCFWIKSDSEEYKCYLGVTNLFPSLNSMTSIACVKDKVVTCSEGALFIWEGRVCVKQVQTFRFPITNLTVSDLGLFVSTQDGTIYLLDEGLETKKRMDPVNNSNNQIIHSMCWEPRRETLLVGDDSHCLREVTLNGVSTPIMSSHPILSSFAVDTRNEIIITAGQDGFVRKWNGDGTDVIQQRNLERELSCIACSRSDSQVVVCFSKEKLADKTDDAFVILDNDLSTIHHGKNSQMTLTTCKFSNDGKLVAFGSKDGSIYIHSMDKNFPLLAKTRGHTAPILTFDFGCAEDSSDTASFIRSNSVNGEALQWSTHGKKLTPISQRQTLWESQSCVYGWYLEGAHDVYTEEGSVRITSCCPLSDKTVVMGDSRGTLRVFSNPVLSKESIYLQFGSHQGRVQEIARCGETLYTFGENDSCLCVWKMYPLNWPSRMPPSLHDDDHRRSMIEEKKDDTRGVSMTVAAEQLENLDFSIVHTNSNTQKPLQPWMRSLVPPSRHTPQTGHHLPSNSLSLERIHGYNGQSARNNLHYLPEGESVLYSVGKTLVKFDEVEDKQQYCTVTGNITCLAVHPVRSLCAIGQKSNVDESIVIVDFNTMKYTSVIKGAAEDTVLMDFDQSGRHLLALSGNRLNIHDVDNGCRLTASTLTHATETLDVRFVTNANTFVEIGKNFVRFWNVSGSEMHFEDVDMSSILVPTTFYTCIEWVGRDLIAGASSGDLIRFAGKVPVSKIRAHTSKITNIISSKTDDKVVISAGSCVKIYDSKFRCKLKLGVRHQISSLSWHSETRKILVGTTGNEVWELSSDNGSNICEGPLICSHSSSPRSISAHPNGSTFATVADDGILHVWGDEHLNFDLDMPSRACAYSPDGRMLAIGLGKQRKDTAKTVNGKWIVIDVSNRSFRTIAERRDTRKFIRNIQWYSSGDRLAVGSDKIHVYSVTSETDPAVKVAITLMSTIDITSPPIHFDYSRDGKYLRVNTDANELVWFEADPAIQIEEASMMKDIEWESETCKFSWNCQGVHHDEAVIKSLDCYTDGESAFVVSGGEDGTLHLHRYPCTSTRSNYLPYDAHGGAVTCLRILRGGSHVITTGEDHAIMIWRHEYEHEVSVVDEDRILSEATDSTQNNVTDMTCSVYDSDDQIIYPTSGVCMVLDKKRTTQTQFQRHDSNVSAVVASTSRRLIASGDNCQDFPSNIWIWDSNTNTEIACLSDSRLRGVTTLAFSPNDKSVACASSDENHKIFVWSTLSGDWNDAYLSSYCLGGHMRIDFLQFTQTHDLIMGGRNCLNFYSFEPSLSVTRGDLSTAQRQGETLLCSAMMGEEKLITGTSGGTLITWNVTKKKIVNEFKAHSGSITSLCSCPEGIVTASSDRFISIWSHSLQKMKVYQTASVIHSLDVGLHSNGMSTMKILASSDKDIFEISCITGKVICQIPTKSDAVTKPEHKNNQ